jgi:uncharacterized protein involved in exopolysaccharide biosynthesis
VTKAGANGWSARLKAPHSPICASTLPAPEGPEISVRATESARESRTSRGSLANGGNPIRLGVTVFYRCDDISPYMDIRQQDPIHGIRGNDLTLGDAGKAVWAGRKVIITVTVTTTLLALGAAMLMRPVYRAEAVVIPVTSTGDTKSLLSGLGGQLGSLAETAGIGLPKGADSSESMGVINSWNLVSQYISRENLLPVIYAKRWDAQRKTWIPSFFGKIPTVWLGTKYFIKNIRTITDDKKTGLVTVSVDWRDPALAARWADDLVTLANDDLRNRAIEESERNIAYLDEQLAKTNVVELRTSIYQLMEGEIKKVMMARGNHEFAFRIVDPAVAPQEKISPRPVLMSAVGALVGILISALFMVRREYVRRSEVA